MIEVVNIASLKGIMIKVERLSNTMDADYTKTLIQQALWNTYKTTGNEDYKKMYDKWYECYEEISIEGLE